MSSKPILIDVTREEFCRNVETRRVDGKPLRRGYTTGSCATAAAQAATTMLLTQKAVDSVFFTTADGTPLTLAVLEADFSGDEAGCAIRKDSGDDPDITDGCLVYARVTCTPEGIEIDGGEGIGRVTKAGLDQPVGAAAINSVPRRSIRQACENVCREHGYTGGLKVIISLPGGEVLAKRTFNGRLGIVGGLSILGTTGIVEPMSQKAVVETLRAELSVLYASGQRSVVLTIGNYGETFARETLGLTLDSQVKCSNFVGETIQAAAESGFFDVLLIGHIGKIVKLGIGITNTHSSYGDGRLETLIACALEADASLETLQRLRQCISCDAAVDTLQETGVLDGTIACLSRRIAQTLERLSADRLDIKLICYHGMGKDMKELFSL